MLSSEDGPLADLCRLVNERLRDHGMIVPEWAVQELIDIHTREADISAQVLTDDEGRRAAEHLVALVRRAEPWTAGQGPAVLTLAEAGVVITALGAVTHLIMLDGNLNPWPTPLLLLNAAAANAALGAAIVSNTDGAILLAPEAASQTVEALRAAEAQLSAGAWRANGNNRNRQQLASLVQRAVALFGATAGK